MGDQASIVSEISATFLDEKDYILLSKERQGRRYFFYYHNRTVDDGLCTPRYSHSPPCKMLLASCLLQESKRISTANVEKQYEYCLVLTGRRRCIQAESSEGTSVPRPPATKETFSNWRREDHLDALEHLIHNNTSSFNLQHLAIHNLRISRYLVYQLKLLWDDEENSKVANTTKWLGVSFDQVQILGPYHWIDIFQHFPSTLRFLEFHDCNFSQRDMLHLSYHLPSQLESLTLDGHIMANRSTMKLFFEALTKLEHFSTLRLLDFEVSSTSALSPFTLVSSNESKRASILDILSHLKQLSTLESLALEHQDCGSTEGIESLTSFMSTRRIRTNLKAFHCVAPLCPGRCTPGLWKSIWGVRSLENLHLGMVELQHDDLPRLESLIVKHINMRCLSIVVSADNSTVKLYLQALLKAAKQRPNLWFVRIFPRGRGGGGKTIFQISEYGELRFLTHLNWSGRGILLSIPQEGKDTDGEDTPVKNRISISTALWPRILARVNRQCVGLYHERSNKVSVLFYLLRNGPLLLDR